MAYNGLIDELVDSKIVQIALLTTEQVTGLREILKLDEDFSFDMLMLMDDANKK